MHTVSLASAAIKPPVHVDVTVCLHAVLHRAVAFGLNTTHATGARVARHPQSRDLAWDRSCVLRSLVSNKLRLMSAELARVSALEVLVAGWALLLMAIELRGDEEQLQRLVEVAEIDFTLAGV